MDPEPAEARADPALDRALGLVQQHRHLLVGAATEIGQFDGLTQLVGQRAEGVLHLFGNSHVPHLTVDVIGGSGRLTGRALLTSTARLLGADHVDGLAVGPGQEE